MSSDLAHEAAMDATRDGNFEEEKPNYVYF